MIKVYYLNPDGTISGSAEYPDYTKGTFDNETSTDIPIPPEIKNPIFDFKSKTWYEGDLVKGHFNQLVTKYFDIEIEKLLENGIYLDFTLVVAKKDLKIKITPKIRDFISFATLTLLNNLQLGKNDKLPNSVYFRDADKNIVKIEYLKDLKDLTNFLGLTIQYLYKKLWEFKDNFLSEKELDKNFQIYGGSSEQQIQLFVRDAILLYFGNIVENYSEIFKQEYGNYVSMEEDS